MSVGSYPKAITDNYSLRHVCFCSYELVHGCKCVQVCVWLASVLLISHQSSWCQTDCLSVNKQKATITHPSLARMCVYTSIYTHIAHVSLYVLHNVLSLVFFCVCCCTCMSAHQSYLLCVLAITCIHICRPTVF